MHSATLFNKPLKPERYSSPFCMIFSTKESQVGTNFQPSLLRSQKTCVIDNRISFDIRLQLLTENTEKIST